MGEPVFESAHLLVDLGGMLQVIPEIRLVHFLLQLFHLFTHMVHMKCFSGRKDALPDSLQVLRILFQFNHLNSSFLY